jgi:alpha-2-macroglobulin
VEPITALVDLNKPAYRLGIAAIKVGWKPHRLDVSVSSERPIYKVRELAKVRVHVTRADGGALPEGTEVAVAAVDGALLELAPNPSWNLLASMMGERGLEVYTSTAQMQVVGKRHYGRKSVPSGGGGGRDRTRELFDTLLYWKGRVALDAQGDALVSVPLNDSLSEFRIVAVANGGSGFFGTGSTTVNTTQDLIILSGFRRWYVRGTSSWRPSPCATQRIIR